MNSAEALISARASEAIYGTSQDPQGQATSQLALAPYGFSVFSMDVGDHSMSDYRQLVEQNQHALAPLFVSPSILLP
jgi:hypothetical protein